MYESRSLTGDADSLASHLDEAITTGSISATIEHQEELSVGDARVIIRIYERYSMMGESRVSLSVSILEVGDDLRVALATSGGSQAVFWKLNTFGEEAFMGKAIEAIDSFPQR